MQFYGNIRKNYTINNSNLFFINLNIMKNRTLILT